MRPAKTKTVSEKLKDFGINLNEKVQVGMDGLRTSGGASRHEIDSVLAGTYQPTPLGDVFVAEQRFSAEYQHGQSALVPLPFPLLAEWANEPRLAELPLEKYAFLDTETSGLAGGTGTYAFLVGAGRFVDGGQFLLQQFFMRDPAEEPALLEGLIHSLAPCEALVTFNGKAFDAPLLVTRYAMHRIPLPFRNYVHLDLLPLARRLWRDRLPSRALKYLEEHVLGLARTIEDVPGYEIPWLYFDYLRTRDARPLRGIFYHNAMDVVAMAALLRHISEMLADPYAGRIQHGLDFIALGKLYEALGRWDEAARLYERGLESLSPASEGGPLSETDFSMAVKRLSILQKKRGDLDRAVQLWEEAANQGHIYAHIELAKFYEHKQRDIRSALRWTEAARKHVEEMSLAAYVRAYWRGEIEHRLARLERKSGSAGKG